jgi:lipid-binding SYLF domain-containing protein
MKRILSAVCLLGAMTVSAYAADVATLNGRLESARTTIEEIMATPDKGIPQEILSDATCVAVIPGLKKAAFVVGGEYGRGVVTCKTGHGWSAPAFIGLTGGSLGLQIGGESTDLVLIAVNQKGFQDLLKSKFKIGADASAAAGPVGRNAQAGTDWKLTAELLTYSRSKGLFAGIDLSGAGISQSNDDLHAFYKSDVAYEQVLKGNVPVPPAARPFVSTVAKYFRSAKAQEKKNG